MLNAEFCWKPNLVSPEPGRLLNSSLCSAVEPLSKFINYYYYLVAHPVETNDLPEESLSSLMFSDVGAGAGNHLSCGRLSGLCGAAESHRGVAAAVSVHAGIIIPL